MKKTVLATAAILAVGFASLAPVSAAFAADATVTGTVTLDGTPIGAVEVGWFDPTTGVTGKTVSAADGTYGLTVTDGHPFLLYAGIAHAAATDTKAPDWGSVGGTSYVGVFEGSNGTDYLYPGRTPFAASASLTGQNIDLDKPGSITGTSPKLADKLINLAAANGDVIDNKKADAAGAFSFAGLIPGNYLVTAADIPGAIDYSSGTVAVAAGQAVTLTPGFAPAAIIAGVVTNKGKPVKGLRISSSKDFEAGDSDITDAKGRYSLKEPEPGRYTLQFAPADGDSPLVNRPILYTTRGASTLSGVTTKLNVAVKKGGSIAGSVVVHEKGNSFVWVTDSKGRVVGGTSVSASAAGKKVSFSIKAVKPGKFTIFVTDSSHTRYGSRAVTVHAGQVNRVASIAVTKKTLSLSGKVVGATKGYVQFVSNAYGLSSSVGKIKNGEYKLTGLIPVRGTIGIEASATARTKFTAFTPGTAKRKSVHAGGAWATLSGTMSVAGLPLLDGQGSVSGATIADEDGSYKAENGVVSAKELTPGRSTLDPILFDSASPFVENSPFWLVVPADKNAVVLFAGQNTDIGAVDLQVGR